MLEDEPRTLAYKNAIEAYNVVKDKVVLGKFTILFYVPMPEFSLNGLFRPPFKFLLEKCQFIQSKLLQYMP